MYGIVRAITPEANALLHDGLHALSKASDRGIPVDVAYCKHQQKRLAKRIFKLEEKVWKTDIGKEWKRKYGVRAKLSDPDQARHIIFNVLKMDESDGRSVSKDVLLGLDHPITKPILKARGYEKASGTFLNNIIRETVDGLMHPGFHLHRVITFRSSSSGPNFQNFPMRDPEIAKLVRSAFRAPPGWVIVEFDYSSLEVRVGTCYHMDPMMVTYLKDSTTDMHRDSAMDCYRLEQDQVMKNSRYAAKNRYVFPEFYGSYWAQVAPDLWKAIAELGLTLPDGTGLYDHLAAQGIHELGHIQESESSKGRGRPSPNSYLKHIMQVESNFWGARFPVYAQWKKDWYKKYQKRGYLDTLTGFRCSGVMKRNEVINSPVQGSAFHCLLKAFIETQRDLEKRKMEAHLVGQIHDSAVGLSPIGELPDFLRVANECSTARLMDAWDWIKVPLEIEVEVSPDGGTWYEKEEVRIPA